MPFDEKNGVKLKLRKLRQSAGVHVALAEMVGRTLVVLVKQVLQTRALDRELMAELEHFDLVSIEAL